MKCSKHQKKCKLLCKTCDKTPVCTSCLTETGGHSEHVFISSVKVAKEVKARLSLLNTDGDKIINELRLDKETVETAIRRQHEHLLEAETDIKITRKRLHGIVDVIADDELQIQKATTNQNVTRLETQEKELKTNLSNLETLRTKVEAVLDEKDDFAAIENAKHIKCIPKFKATTVLRLDTIKYKEHKIIDAFVQTLSCGEHCKLKDDETVYPKAAQTPVVSLQYAGTIPKSMVEVSSFKYADEGIHFIRPSEKSCMLRVQHVKEIKWTDKSGSVQNTKPFNATIYGFTVTLDNRLLLCCYDKMEILEATVGSVRCVVSTSPLKPFDIGVSKTGDYIVTVRDDATYNITNTSIRCVIVYNKDWKETARVIKDNYGHNLCVRPGRMSISSSGTIAIVNSTGDGFRHLVILEPTLHLKFRIIGKGKVVPADQVLPDLRTCDKYAIQDVEFVSSNHMVVSEFRSKSIQLLDDKGMVITVLHKYVDIVWSLCIDNEGQVWTGDKKGRVVVYKLQ